MRPFARRGSDRPTERDGPPTGPDRPVPGSLHAFNRYEVKYLVPFATVSAIRTELAARMIPDRYSPAGGYGVWSTYYDTPGLKFYWEKIEGLRFRRKLRIRHYGDRSTVTEDSPVFVEIKQRVNRVTQKRRVSMPYRQARELCGRGVVDGDDDKPHRAFLEEVAGLARSLSLRPTAITGYQRSAYAGVDADLGLRVTVDSRVRGRDRDFNLAADAENRLIVPAMMSIVEVKANERIPYWITDLAARHGMSVVRVSKYCQSVEAFDKAPRSAFHVPEADESFPTENTVEA